MIDEDPALPPALAAAHRLPYSDGEDVDDFEPFEQFDPAGDTTAWWRLWTTPAAGRDRSTRSPEPPGRSFPPSKN